MRRWPGAQVRPRGIRHPDNMPEADTELPEKPGASMGSTAGWRQRPMQASNQGWSPMQSRRRAPAESSPGPTREHCKNLSAKRRSRSLSTEVVAWNDWNFAARAKKSWPRPTRTSVRMRRKCHWRWLHRPTTCSVSWMLRAMQLSRPSCQRLMMLQVLRPRVLARITRTRDPYHSSSASFPTARTKRMLLL